MPAKKNNLVKEKKAIIRDIIFENIVPNSHPGMFWGLDMLTTEIRKHNIDEHLHINRYDVKNILKKLANSNKKISLHMINNDLYFKFLS